MSKAQISALNLAQYCAKRAKAWKQAGNVAEYEKMVSACENWLKQAAY